MNPAIYFPNLRARAGELSAAGTSQSYIARLEADDIDPQLSTLVRLAKVFGMQTSALVEAMTAKSNLS